MGCSQLSEDTSFVAADQTAVQMLVSNSAFLLHTPQTQLCPPPSSPLPSHLSQTLTPGQSVKNEGFRGVRVSWGGGVHRT